MQGRPLSRGVLAEILSTLLMFSWKDAARLALCLLPIPNQSAFLSLRSSLVVAFADKSNPRLGLCSLHALLDSLILSLPCLSPVFLLAGKPLVSLSHCCSSMLWS